jgi:glycosyltransferase involved in cell wall biosynthesis
LSRTHEQSPIGSPKPDGRIRVLLIAELCNPGWVSVPLEGWSHGRAIAALTDTHLVTHVRNRDNITKAGLIEGHDFTAIDSSLADDPLALISGLLGGRFGTNRGWTTLTAFSTLSYYYFERLVWRRFERDIRARAYDIVHRLTPLSPVTPSLLAKRCARAGVPFVLGPLNGGLPWPRGFGGVRIREREWLSYVRRAYRWLPGYRSTRAHAAAIIVGSRATRSELSPSHLEKAVYIPENAVDPARFDQQVGGPAQRPLRIAFVGRLVPYKGADMLLEAAAPLARAGEVTLDIIGDGPELPALRALAQREAISGSVSFAGWVGHRELKERLAGCHVLGFPSIREFGGAVVVEAMALGLVPIVIDYGGPGELVTPATGFALPLGPRTQIVRDLRSVLERLAVDPSVIRPMGARARDRVLRGFTWPAKAAQVREVYRWVLGRRDKPDFGMPLTDPP